MWGRDGNRKKQEEWHMNLGSRDGGSEGTTEWSGNKSPQRITEHHSVCLPERSGISLTVCKALTVEARKQPVTMAFSPLQKLLNQRTNRVSLLTNKSMLSHDEVLILSIVRERKDSSKKNSGPLQKCRLMLLQKQWLTLQQSFYDSNSNLQPDDTLSQTLSAFMTAKRMWRRHAYRPLVV